MMQRDNFDDYLEWCMDVDLLSRMMTGNFRMTCGECPADKICLSMFKEQPDIGGESCRKAILEWLNRPSELNERGGSA